MKSKMTVCLLFTCVVAAASFAHAQQIDPLLQDGFEFRAPSYGYSFTTDQFVVAQNGRSYEFEVLVRDALGAVVNTGDVTWTSSNPAVTALTVVSPRRVRVAVAGNTALGVVRISARHADTPLESSAQLIFETLQPTSRFVPGNLLISANASTATFAVDPLTSVLVAGDVVMVGDSNALLVRINSIANVGAQRVAQTTPAYINEYFVESAAPVAIESDPLQFRVHIRDGQVSYFDRANRLLDRAPLTPESVNCSATGGGNVAVDVNKIVLNGIGPNDYTTWRINYDWRQVRLGVTGNWTAQVTVLPGAITVNGNVGFNCSLELPSVAVPYVGFSLYTAKIGLTVAPTLFLESNVSVSTEILQNIELFGRTSGAITTGLRWGLFDGWVPFGSIDNVSSNTEIRRVGNTVSTTTTNVNVKTYLRAEPELGVSGANFTAFTTRFAEIDLGTRMALQTQTPLNPQLFNYVGPSGDVSGLARAKLKSPQVLNDLIDLLRRAFITVNPPPTNLQLQLFDTEPVRLNWDAANMIVSPSQVTQACAAPNVQFLVSNLRETATLVASAFARGTYRIHLYSQGNDSAPVWISPEQTFSFGLSQYSVPIDQIRDAGGNAITGDLRAQVRASYVLDPISRLLPVRASAPQTVRIVTAPLNCGGSLNDTGQDWCANATTGNLTCPQSGFPRQDGEFGRDALARAGQLTKIGGGEAGFDFTKISNSGQVLPAAAALGSGANDWACTRDNVTGLLWEVKLNNAASLRHQTHRYTWYSTDSSINGGNPGSVGSAGSCGSTLSLCNTQAFVAAVNAQGLCGFNDWRMPDQGQLLGIVSHKRINPAIDPTYFVNTPNSFYWTGRNVAGFASDAWVVYFYDGNLFNDSKTGTNHVRLVRGGQ